MEKRTFIAVMLSMGLLLAYTVALEHFYPRTPARSTEQPSATRQAPEAPAPPPSESTRPPEPAAAPPPPAVPPVARAATPGPRPPQKLVTVETPLYRGVISSEGGKLQELTLKYRGDKPLVLTGEVGPVGLAIAPEAGADPAVVPMEVQSDALTVGAGQPRKDLSLSGTADGLRVREVLGFDSATYAVTTRVRVENTTRAPRAVTVSLAWSTRQIWHEAKEKFPGQHPTEIVYAAAGQLERLEHLCDFAPVSTEGAWIATGSTWYLAALVPKSPGFRLAAAAEAKGCDTKSKDPAGRATVAVTATPTIAPGQAWEGEVLVYAGPKEYDRLKALGLQDTLNFGGFPVPRRYGGLPMEWLGVPILVLMNWVYDRIGNYGLAIVLLTVVSKVLFFPLTVKSMRSMKAMQALQPQVNTLRSKYKKDPQALQRETLELYRKHKVNPMGGCLPMVAQIPIFYALYLALSVSVELQNASFLCFGRLFGADVWICDLATHDPTYVLPILMGVTMFIQQKMTPTMGDPRQAKMMLFMPIVFTFMFLNLPSGLVLYWTVSNVLQIAQQYYLDRPKRARAAREAKDASRA